MKSKLQMGFIISAGSKVGLCADVCFFVSPQQAECKSSPKESKEAAVDLLGLGKSATFHQSTIKHSSHGEITCQTPPPPTVSRMKMKHIWQTDAITSF